MYSDLYQMLSLLLPGGREIRGYVRQLERTQWFSASEREAWQLARIQALVKHAYTHVPFYQELYREAGAHPEDIQTLQDFRALPFVTRADVKNNLDRLVVPHWDGKLDRSETGGSTGTPMQFYVEDAFWRWNIALEARGRRWYGVQVGDKMAWVWGAPRDIPLRDWRKRLRALVRRQRFLNAFMLSEAKMLAFAKMLAEWKPTIIRGYPAALTPFANIVEEKGITGIRPRVIETSGEKVTELQRALLEKVFQCPVVDHYGSRELGAIAWQCPTGSQHVSETHYMETVVDGEMAGPGKLGEIVVTSFIRNAMPLIRYKNDDLGILDAETCACGRGLQILREVTGRKDDLLVTESGELVHGVYFAYIFRVRPQVAQFQVFQPDVTHLQIRIVCKSPVGPDWLAEVRNAIKARFGPSTEVDLEVVDEIQLTPAGKHRFTISQVKPDLGRQVV